MEPQSIRMPADLWNEIRSEAERRDRTAAEHIRHICRQHLEADVEELHGRVDELEARLDSLEGLEREVDRLDALEEEVERLESLEAELDRLDALETKVDRLESLEGRVDELEAAVRAGTGETGEDRGTSAAGGAPGAAEEREARTGGTEQPESARGREQAVTTEGATEAGRGKATAEGTMGGSGTSPSRQITEPVESVEDVIRAAEVEYGEGAVAEMLPEGQAALEALQREGRVPEDRLRQAIAQEFAATGRPEAWWAEHVQPLLDVAAKWGLVVAHSDGDLEWVGSP